MKTHKDLEVWKNGINIVKLTYQTTMSFPKEELFGLVSQIRRSAVSIVSNIAEGAGRQSDTEFRRFLKVHRGA